MTYRDNYPTGRKHCSYCGRWRPVTDFPVREWTDPIAREIPRTFTSLCRRCEAEKQRQRKGHRPRQWYEHGPPGSRQATEHKREVDRESRRRRREDPEYREREREYWRIWNHVTNGATIRQTLDDRSRVYVDSGPLLAWADRRRDLHLTPTQARQLRRIRSEGTDTVLEFVDEVLTANGDHHLVAVLYPHSEAA